MNTVLSAHITHKTVDVKRLELIGSQSVPSLIEALRGIDGVRECAVLKTCNRVELYTVTFDWEATRRGLELFVSSFIPFDSDENLVQFLSGEQSIRHLLRVAGGLESMIIGEDQVQSQVKESFELAKKMGSTGPILSLIFRKAISVGKKVRSDTKLNKGAVSIGSAAVDLAESKIGDLKGKTVLVIGAGEMATLIAKHLIGKKPEAVFVSNRTYSRAVELAWALDGKAVRFDSLVDFLIISDVVICATSATHMILEKKHIVPAMAGRLSGRMVIIDVSVPRNVAADVKEIQGVELYDIDGLRGVAAKNLLRRKQEVRDAERIISEELKKLNSTLDEMSASIAIKLLYRKFDDIKRRETEKALNRIDVGEDLTLVLNDFSDALIYRFLADPTEALKMASRNGEPRYIEMVRELFKVKEGEMFPEHRMRRLRLSKHTRDLVRETQLSVKDLIFPLFVNETLSEPKPIPSMPGISSYPVEDIANMAKRVQALGIPAVLLFGIPGQKDEMGSGAWDDDGVVQRAVRMIKRDCDLAVITDLCLCEYTSHGHCGLVREGRLSNDDTLEAYGRTAVSQAKAGADMVAPSGMMDGQVSAIRRALDSSSFVDIPIMAYSAKFASAFYGPFRDAVESAPQFGDRRSHQMDPANSKEAMRELELDLEEGADILMVKPALPYLDIISKARTAFSAPIAAYNVSGEYAMLKAAACNGWLDERRAVIETLTSIKRAGADMIITYHALDVAEWLKEAE